jgi:4-amino-4-deoxychorismate lyase
VDEGSAAAGCGRRAHAEGGRAVSILAVAVTGRGLVDAADPVIPAGDEAFLRGRAVFETTRVYAGHPFRLDEHLDRLERSAASLALDPPDRAALLRLVAQAVEATDEAECSLRLFWTPSGLGLAITAVIPGWIDEVRARGARTVTLRWPRSDVPWLLGGVKSTSYAANLAAEAEAKRRGADDAIFVDADGTVLEGPVTNVWWRHGDRLCTPSLDLGILAGVTRRTVLELAPVHGYRVEEGRYPVDDLLAADEAFTSSSVRELLPVVEIDGARLERGPAADELQEGLRALAGRGGG